MGFTFAHRAALALGAVPLLAGARTALTEMAAKRLAPGA